MCNTLILSAKQEDRIALWVLALQTEKFFLYGLDLFFFPSQFRARVNCTTPYVQMEFFGKCQSVE